MMEIEATFPTFDLTVTKPVEISTNKTGDEAIIVSNRITYYLSKLSHITGDRKSTSFLDPWFRFADHADATNDDGSYLHKAQEFVRKAELVHRQYKRTTLMTEIEERFEKIEKHMKKDSEFYKSLVEKFGSPSSDAYDELTMEELRDRHFKIAMETDELITKLHNARFYEQEYNAKAYKNYRDPQRARELFEKMKKIGFYNVDNHELFILTLELMTLIPSSKVINTMNNKLY